MLTVVLTMVGALVGAPVVGSASAQGAVAVDAWTAGLGGPASTGTNAGESVITAATAARVRQVWQTNTAGTGQDTAPVVVDGVVYVMSNPRDNALPPTLLATDARTGAVRWSLPMPATGEARDYLRGLAISGNLLVASYSGWHVPGGMTAIDLRAHRIAWEVLFANQPDGQQDTYSNPVTVDSTRVYTTNAEGLTAYRLRDGAHLWSHAYAYPNGTSGQLAAHRGKVFVGERLGLAVYDGATGRRLWTGAGDGQPVVAGGRVFITLGGTNLVYAHNESGCGQPTCRPVWTRNLGDTFIQIGAADRASLETTYLADGSTPGWTGWTAHLTRLDAATGRTESDISYPGQIGAAIRAADLTWVVTIRAKSNGSGDYALEAYPTTGRRTRPIATLVEPGLGGFPQGTAIASGAILYQQWGGPVTAFRVPDSTAASH